MTLAAPPAPRTWVVGLNEHALLGDGWYPRTRDARCGLAYRPARPDGAWLHWPALPPAGRLRLLLFGAATATGGEVEVRALLRDAEEHPIAEERFRFASDLWTWRDLVWRAATPPQPASLLLETTPAFIPTRVFANRDYRPMGLYWGGLRLFTEEEDG